jgi:predicted nucleic acid-binding protein
MRVAIDANVLVYIEGVGDAERCKRAADVVAALDVRNVVLTTQIPGELFNVLTKTAGRSATQARDAVLSWRDAFDVADSARDAVTTACDLAAAHQLQFWDALIVSVAVRQQCRVLLTEDMNERFVWQGMTVVNPFALRPHPLLARVLVG